LGVLDASECPPTYGVSPDLIQGIIAGGPAALTRSQEGAEDQKEEGIKALKDRNCSKHDVVMGIAASGVTPFVIGALNYARQMGATTIFFSCNPEAAKTVDVDVHITPKVGPEVITGSTRMKAGTATKLVLNMITTTAMVKLGKVYENLMVDLAPSCAKLRDRSERILSLVTGLDQEQSQQALLQAGDDLKTAIVMNKRAVSLQTARQLLSQNNGIVKRAIEDTSL
jgi:N-acetylmuramic acid 6-phosphate etherase